MAALLPVYFLAAEAVHVLRTSSYVEVSLTNLLWCLFFVLAWPQLFHHLIGRLAEARSRLL